MSTTAVAKIGHVSTMRDLLKKHESAFLEVMPRHLTMERMTRIACASVSRMPKLLECTPASFLSAFMTASQLGLEPNGPLGLAWIIPYPNRQINACEAQFQVGYKGLIDLARRSGDILSIEAHIIYENEKFTIAYGLDPKLEHEPLLVGDRGKFLAVYAVARLKDGGTQADVMTLADVERIREMSKQHQTARKNNRESVWDQHFDEMAKKTVVKRLCKLLPCNVELADAIAYDNAVEAGQGLPFDLPPDGEVGQAQDAGEETPAEDTTSSKGQRVRERLRQSEPAGDASQTVADKLSEGQPS